jgi:polyisoprenoid-binding protein YceI
VVADGTWSIDAARSRIAFVASHVFGFGRVTGSFSDFSGEITTLAGAIASAHVTIGADSISTGNDRRDADLRSPAFLDVESHAKISYVTSELQHEGDGRYRIVGTLTARGTSAEVPLNAKLVDASGGVLRARALATFNRRALGITPGARGLVVGRLVGVEIEVLAARGE